MALALGRVGLAEAGRDVHQSRVQTEVLDVRAELRGQLQHSQGIALADIDLPQALPAWTQAGGPQVLPVLLSQHLLGVRSADERCQIDRRGLGPDSRLDRAQGMLAPPLT